MAPWMKCSRFPRGAKTSDAPRKELGRNGERATVPDYGKQPGQRQREEARRTAEEDRAPRRREEGRRRQAGDEVESARHRKPGSRYFTKPERTRWRRSSRPFAL